MALQDSSPNSALKGETLEDYEVPAHLLGDTANLHLEETTYDRFFLKDGTVLRWTEDPNLRSCRTTSTPATSSATLGCRV